MKFVEVQQALFNRLKYWRTQPSGGIGPQFLNTIADVTFVQSVETDGRYRFIFVNQAFEKAWQMR